MASSNALDITKSPETCVVALPTETTAAGEGNQGNGNVLPEKNSSSAYMYRLGSDIPEIPDIPSPLMRPPTSGQTTLTGVGPGSNLPFSSAFVTKSGYEVSQRDADPPADSESKNTTENLDSMIKNHVGRQVDRVFSDAVKDFQSHLRSRASEVDQLRVELQNMEHKEKDMFSGISGIPARTQVITTHQYPSVSTTISGPLRGGSLITRTGGYSIPGIGNTGTEFGLRDSSSQIDDLKRKLKMTTELCAKQDAYYREVVSDLENRLKESIAGRDHVLALRENEAEGQLQLIHQLEAGLRKQQQIIEAKDEGLNSLQSSIKQLEEDLAAHKSFLGKIRRIALEEDKKRFRSGLVTSALENTVAVGQIGNALVELMQRCLFDDDKEKRTLQSTLDRVEAEFKSSREQTENKHEELQKEYKARVSKLEEEHAQALELSANRAALVRKELETLQQEADKMKEDHQTAVSALEDKGKSMELELERTRKTSYETRVTLEAKCKELEYSVRDLKGEVQSAREEQQSLYSRLSQEQANVITLNEKLSSTEKHRQEAEEKNESLTRELANLREKYLEEANGLRSNIAEKERLIKEIREESTRLRESEVEKAVYEEREKSNIRLDGILNELTKSNQSILTLKEDLLAKEVDLSKQRDELGKVNNGLELRTKEMNLLREEKINLTGELDKRQGEISNLQRNVAELSSSLDAKVKGLEEAQNSVEKLQTQLLEREKVLASFQAQGTNLAEIIEKNSQTGDSLQREREQLIRTLEERISEVEEMKSHREILAKKLRAKDKRVKELEEEKGSMLNGLKNKQEELDALMEDRSNIMAELKLRQIEVTKLKDENGSLSKLVEGKHGEREKEITKLLSRLKGSEQDLALTRKLLKTKGDMSGKAVRVAESMQQEVTAKRGELDALQNKIHWLTESLNTASKDARYYERRSSEFSETVNQLTVDRDQLEFELRKTREQRDDQRKQLNHMEQALEKAALKHADSQGVIEKMEQEMARLKLKHSLEVKELERTSKAFPIRADAASLIEILTKLNSGFRWPPLTTQANYSSLLMAPKHPPILLPPAPGPQTEVAELDTGQQTQTAQSREASDSSSRKNDEVADDLKLLLHEVRSLISSFQAHVSQTATPARTPGPGFSSQGPPERGPLDDGPMHPNEAVMDVKTLAQAAHNMATDKGNSGLITGNRHGKEQNGKGHQSRTTKERSRPRPVLDNKHDQETDKGSVSSLTTDLNSRVSSNYEPDNSDDIEDFAIPLHSSSPKRESVTSSESLSECSQTRDRPHSPLLLSINSDGDDVTSLLIDQSTSTGDTVISRDLVNAPRVWSKSSASSVSSIQRSSSKNSYSVPFKTQHSRPAPPNLEVRQLNGRVASSRAWTTRRNQEELSRKLDSDSARKTASESEPVYRRAEMILQSLAQTGEQLTKKNREIEHLLKEQDRRIKKCRKNEDNIQALLS